MVVVFEKSIDRVNQRYYLISCLYYYTTTPPLLLLLLLLLLLPPSLGTPGSSQVRDEEL